MGMVEEIEDVTDPEVVAGDVIDPGAETGDGIVTGVMTGEGETGVTPEITGGVVTALRDQMTKNWNFKRCKSRCHVAHQYFNFNFVCFHHYPQCCTIINIVYTINLPKYLRLKLF